MHRTDWVTSNLQDAGEGKHRLVSWCVGGCIRECLGGMFHVVSVCFGLVSVLDLRISVRDAPLKALLFVLAGVSAGGRHGRVCGPR